MTEPLVLADDPRPGVRRLTLNRPDKRNALSNSLRRQLFDELRRADQDRDVSVVVIRGAGPSFSAGYDLAPEPNDPLPRPIATRDGFWSRHLVEGWFEMMDMSTPIIAQVHGYCLAGGTDLATLCDMLVCADDARFGFPPGRDLGVLPTQMWLHHVGPQWSKRLLLTGDTVSGAEAAQIGLALKSVPADELAAEVDGLARRLALVDRELLAANKRVINLGLELMGARTMQRLATEIDARGHLVDSAAGFRRNAAEHGLREALRRRDAPFGDGRARVNGPERRDDHGALIDPD